MFQGNFNLFPRKTLQGIDFANIKINFKGLSLGYLHGCMLIILYLTSLKPAKRARLTRSSFITHQTSLGLSGGCEQLCPGKIQEHGVTNGKNCLFQHSEIR